MSIEENKKIVTDFWRRFLALDLDGTFAMVTEDFTWWVGGDPAKFPLAGLRGKAEMRAVFDGLTLLVPKGVTVTPKAFTAEGERVAVEAESYGETLKGKTYNNRYHFLIELENGKIKSVREYLDTMHTNDVFCT